MRLPLRTFFTPRRRGVPGRDQAGFSLVEALIVVLIAAIVCVLAIPQATAALRLNRINTLNALLASKLAEARIQAIKRNGPVSLKVNFQTRRIWIESGAQTLGAAESFSAENTIAFAPSSSPVQEVVTFNSFGNLQTAPVTITVNSAGANRAKPLQVSVTGKITPGAMTAIQ